MVTALGGGSPITLVAPLFGGHELTWREILSTDRPFDQGNFQLIVSEDDSTHVMAREERYLKDVTVPPGIYVLDFYDWNKTARVEVALSVDGVNWFRGAGSSKNIHDWSDWRKWHNVKQTSDRAIAFELK